jgi:uncharacterized membrane protein YeaQ/YmgE (transglycosylase-associated protein family)
MSIGGFFLLLFLSILVRYLGNKFVPVLMPPGRLKTWGIGIVGGFLGSYAQKILWHGPQIANIYILGAFIGCSLFVLGWGLVPFFKIAIGKRP